MELTTSESVAKLPVSTDVLINKLFDVLLYVPLVEAVTLTAIIHVLKPATVIFENVSGSLTVAGDGDAPHPVYVTEELARVIPAGKSSIKLTPVSAAEPGLLIVKVRVEVPPGLIVFGENVLMRLVLTILA